MTGLRHDEDFGRNEQGWAFRTLATATVRENRARYERAVRAEAIRDFRAALGNVVPGRYGPAF